MVCYVEPSGNCLQGLSIKLGRWLDKPSAPSLEPVHEIHFLAKPEKNEKPSVSFFALLSMKQTLQCWQNWCYSRSYANVWWSRRTVKHLNNACSCQQFLKDADWSKAWSLARWICVISRIQLRAKLTIASTLRYIAKHGSLVMLDFTSGKQGLCSVSVQNVIICKWWLTSRTYRDWKLSYLKLFLNLTKPRAFGYVKTRCVTTCELFVGKSFILKVKQDVACFVWLVIWPRSPSRDNLKLSVSVSCIWTVGVQEL